MRTNRFPFVLPVMIFGFLVVAAVSSISGGDISPCHKPRVFSGAGLNTYIKQFEVVSDPTLPLDAAGGRLALLIQFAGLYSQIGYGPLGFISLRIEPGYGSGCSNAMILARITGKECCAIGELQPGHAAMILSGRFELIEDDIYLLMQVEFMRRDVDETIVIPLPDTTGGDLDFTGQLPRTSISLTPRKLTRNQINRIDSVYHDNIVVRGYPDVDTSGRYIDPFDIDGMSFTITDIQDGWLRVKSYAEGYPDDGWVKVPGDIGIIGLRDLLPDLYFLDATAIYLQTRVAAKSLSSREYARHMRSFEEHFRNFRQRAKQGGDQKALGMLHAMHGFLLLSGPRSESLIEKAADDFQKAAKLMPTNGNARALASMTNFSAALFGQASTGSIGFGDAASQLELALLRTIDAEPGNFYGKVNLERLYVLRQRLGDTEWESDGISQLRYKLRQDSTLEALVPER